MAAFYTTWRYSLWPCSTAVGNRFSRCIRAVFLVLLTLPAPALVLAPFSLSERICARLGFFRGCRVSFGGKMVMKQPVSRFQHDARAFMQRVPPPPERARSLFHAPLFAMVWCTMRVCSEWEKGGDSPPYFFALCSLITRHDKNESWDCCCFSFV